MCLCPIKSSPLCRACLLRRDNLGEKIPSRLTGLFYFSVIFFKLSIMTKGAEELCQNLKFDPPALYFYPYFGKHTQRFT